MTMDGPRVSVTQPLDFDGDGNPDAYVTTHLTKEQSEAYLNVMAVIGGIVIAVLVIAYLSFAISTWGQWIREGGIWLSESVSIWTNWVSTWTTWTWTAIGLTCYVVLP